MIILKQSSLDRVFAVLVLLLAIALFAVSSTYSAPSALFPRALCVLLASLSLVLMCTRTSVQAAVLPPGEPRAAVFVMCAVLLWLLMVRMVNVELATLLLALACLRVLGMRNWLWNWNTAAGLMLLVHLLFFRLLDVARPQSWWL